MAIIWFAGRQLEADEALPLNIALARAGVPVESPCGGRGRCGRCGVRLSGPVPPPSKADLERFSTEEVRGGFRLSCQHRAADGLQVEVAGWAGIKAAIKAPVNAEAAEGQAATASLVSLSPLVERRVAAVSIRASQAGGLWEEIARSLKDPLLPVPQADILRRLPSMIASGEGRVTVYSSARGAGHGPAVIGLEAGVPEGGFFGVAVDIGTTSLAVSLVELDSGMVVAGATGLNPQSAYGADIMSRLGHALRGAGARDLRAAVVQGVNELLRDVFRQAGIDSERVWCAAVSGNTVMHHLFFALDVSTLAAAPYIPVALGAVITPASDSGLAIRPEGVVYCLPLLGGFVGGDLSGVLLATRLWESKRPTLVMDLGTNGEILLGFGGRVWACSTAAGPAFEGGAISCGMRGVPGAIQGVAIGNGDVELDVIGGVQAKGICGSGLIDAVAELIKAGVIDASGRFRDGSALPGPLAARLAEMPDGPAFTLSEGVVITQKDVRQLQLAKGAVRAGAEILMEEAGVSAGDLEEVLLAGTFGNYINEEKALAIGLLPPVPPERIRPVGNAALAGTIIALLSADARVEIEAAAREVIHLPLAMREDFQRVFMENLGF